jgi:hypothetical protein
MITRENLSMPQFKSVVPVSNEDTNALPVKVIGPAVSFYQTMLEFAVVRCEPSSAVLARDEVQIGLVCKADHEPAEAGSIAFAVDDLDAVYRELQTKGGDLGEFGIDEWGGKKYRTFFLREDENGYCYCFFHPASP